MDIRPVGDRILIRLTDKEAGKEVITDGGIVLPEIRKQKERYITSEVIAVGPGELLKDGRRTEMVEVGDWVVHNYYAGHKIRDDLFMLRMSEVQAKDVEKEQEETEAKHFVRDIPC